MEGWRIVYGGSLALLVMTGCYFILRQWFATPYGVFVSMRATPDLMATRGEQFSSLLERVRRIWGFYTPTIAVFVLMAGSLTPLGDVGQRVTVMALVAGFIFAALTRLLCLVHSGFMTETLVSLTLGFFGLLTVQAAMKPGWLHLYVQDVLRVMTPEFAYVYLFFSTVMPGMLEILLTVVWKQFPFTRSTSYGLFREYHEAFQIGEMRFHTSEVSDLCLEAIAGEIGQNGLQYLYWKTATGNRRIVKAVIDAVASNQARLIVRRYDEMDDQEKHKFSKVAVPPELERLSREGNLRVIMPTEPVRNRMFVSQALRTAPISVPNMGSSRRFLILNRRLVIIGLDASPRELDLHAANLAWATRDLDRVHECICEFDSICSTYDMPPSS